MKLYTKKNVRHHHKWIQIAISSTEVTTSSFKMAKKKKSFVIECTKYSNLNMMNECYSYHNLFRVLFFSFKSFRFFFSTVSLFLSPACFFAVGPSPFDALLDD